MIQTTVQTTIETGKSPLLPDGKKAIQKKAIVKTDSPERLQSFLLLARLRIREAIAAKHLEQIQKMPDLSRQSALGE